MASPGWYNENLYRDYPFVTRTQPLRAMVPMTGLFEGVPEASSSSFPDLPHSAIVDFGCIMEIDAGFDEADGHFIYLKGIYREANTFVFVFATNAPNASNQWLAFYLDYPATQQYKIVWGTALFAAPEEVSELACPQTDKWSGFMVAGDLEALATLIPDGDGLDFVPGFWQIEPGRVQNLRGTYLRAITLANTPRLLVDNADGCGSNSSDTNTDAILQASCIVGDIKLVEGYNCSIRQDRVRNTITINAGVGLGSGEPCEEVPRYPAEIPPADSPYLSGGPGCNEIIKSINGIGGSAITITGGPGYRILPDTLKANKLIVERVLSDFAICAEPDTDPLEACVNFYDTFTGTGLLATHTPDIDESGNGWLAFRGVFSLDGGIAKVTLEGASPRTVALMSTGHADAKLGVDVNFSGTNTSIAHGIAYRWNPFTVTGWLLGIDATGNSLKLWWYDGTTFHLAGTDTFAVSLDTTYRVEVDCRGDAHRCRVYDGNSLLAEIILTSTTGMNNNHHGIRGGAILDVEVVFDNFTQCVAAESSSASASSSSSMSASAVVDPPGPSASEVIP